MPFASYPARLRSRAAAGGALAPAFALAIAAISGSACSDSPHAPPPELGAVEGAVFDPLGHPVSEVVVELTTDPPDGRVPIATARTAPGGAFKLERVPLGNYQLRAKRRTFAVAVSPVVVAPGIVQADMHLVALVRLRGRIEDGHATAVPLAHVIAFAVAEASSPTLHETRADAWGHFSLDDLQPGAYRLLIEAPGLGTAAAGPVTAPDAEVLVVFPGESRSVTGLVTRLGRPAHGVRVHLGGEAVSEPRMTETDTAGRFAFPGLGPGTYALRAESGAFVSPVVSDVVVAAVSQLRQIDLALDEATFLHGRVVDDGGVGVPGALVRLDLIPATGLWASVDTDGQGDWNSPPLPPGRYQLRARRAGYTARRTVVVDLPPRRDLATTPTSSAPVSVRLALLRTGELVGRVVADDGTPVAGAKIHDRPATVEELGVIASPLPAAATAASAAPGALGVGDARIASRQAQSGSDGRFALVDVPPGRLRIEILHPSAVPFRGRPLTLPPGGTLDLGTLALARAARLSGHVVDSDGRPAAGARVTARGNTGVVPDSGLYAVTGRDGDFSLPLGPGEHAVVASMDGRPDAEAIVRVSRGSVPIPVTLRFAKAGNLSGAAANERR